MERNLFVGLIRAATEEITARHASYFEFAEVAVPELARLRQHWTTTLFERFTTAELEAALIRGGQVLEDLGVPVRLDCEEPDSISIMLAQSILDAYAASTGFITLQAPPPERDLQRVLSDSYSVETSRNGNRFILAKHGGTPLLIVSAIGTPLRIWSKLLDDRSTGLRCLVVESRGTSLIDGGTPRASNLYEDAADIRQVLEENALAGVHVLAWCSGARTGIELARICPERIASLTLLSPSFHGALDAETYPSPFEDNLATVYSIVRENPEAGKALLNSLTTPRPAAERSDPSEYAHEVLLSPPHAYVRSLLGFLSTIDQFHNYMERLSGDSAYDVHAAIAEATCPLYLVAGTHDAATNVHVARHLLTRSRASTPRIEICGGGHHLCLLQYSHFIYTLRSLICGSMPVSTARLSVESLAGAWTAR
jgi:pimeloyl-ACP methyl ester carboxylesterase